MVPVPEKFGPKKSTGTGTRKIWYRGKVPEPVPEKFGPGKSTVTGKKMVPEKSTGTVTEKNLGTVPGTTVTLWHI